LTAALGKASIRGCLLAIFQWSDRFNTGVDEVDRQHQRLMAMLNELDEARTLGGEAQVMLGLLDGLVDYTRYHFSTEEALMRGRGFDPEVYRAHRAEHQTFVDQVVTARANAQASPTVVGDRLLGFLVHWLTEHMLGTDQKMGRLLRARGNGDGEQTVGPPDALLDALRESEERFRELADAVPALIWMTDDQGRRVYVNLQWSLFTGRPRQDLTGDGWLECLHPGDRERIAQLHREAKAGREPLVAELRLHRSDGKYRWLWESAVPRRRRDASFAGMVGCAFDITERRQVEQLLRTTKTRLETMVRERTRELEQANMVLQQRNQVQEALLKELRETQAQLLHSEKMAGIGQLAAGVAHEINNPVGYVYSNLGALEGYLADLLRLLDSYAAVEAARPGDAGPRRALEEVKAQVDLEFLRTDMLSLVRESLEGAQRARQIVQSLRDFSRLDHKDLEPFDLEAGLDATLNIVNNELKYKAKVVKEYAGLGSVPCVGGEINQVFLNLLMNAVQAIDGQGVITLRSGREQRGRVWVEVEDTGRGIPKATLSRIFEPFFTTKSVGRGTGLGLSISYGIVKKHRGEIEVHSEVGVGSRFRVWLPETAAAAPAGPDAPVQQGAAP
jgi:two-component system, NtrC family, sensor kinase